MTDKTKFPTDAQAQCERFIIALAHAGAEGITSYYANRELGIYHPPARIKQLRESGFNIVTLWKKIEEDLCRPRRVARYVLISRPEEDAA